MSSLCLVSWVRRDNYSIRYSEAIREKDGWNDTHENCNNIQLGERPEPENGDPTRVRLSRDFSEKYEKRDKPMDRLEKEFYEEWMLLASLLDRVFFIVYLCINIAAASAIFTRAIP